MFNSINSNSVSFTGLARTKKGNFYNKCNVGKTIGGVTLGMLGGMTGGFLGLGMTAPVGIAGGAIVDHFINIGRIKKADTGAKLDKQA